MGENERRARFEGIVLVHLDAAHNLARWLTGNDADAQDAVQEACLRAYRYFEAFRGGSARPWLLGIVRNACYSLRGAALPPSGCEVFDERLHGPDALAAGGLAGIAPDPQALAIAKASREALDGALASLPLAFREVLVLRELEDLSYRDIARIAQVPIGTVMSRLARARAMLRAALAARPDGESR